MISVKRLSLVISHEERTLENLEYALVMDVRIGVVYEYTWFGITCRIYMEVVSPTCNTTADEFAVVLEVHREELYRAFA